MQKSLKVREIIKLGKTLKRMYDNSRVMTFSNAYKLRKVMDECGIVEEYVSRRLNDTGVFAMGGLAMTDDAIKVMDEIDNSEVTIEIPEITEEEFINDKGLKATMEDIEAIEPILAKKEEDNASAPQR